MSYQTDCIFSPANLSFKVFSFHLQTSIRLSVLFSLADICQTYRFHMHTSIGLAFSFHRQASLKVFSFNLEISIGLSVQFSLADILSDLVFSFHLQTSLDWHSVFTHRHLSKCLVLTCRHLSDWVFSFHLQTCIGWSVQFSLADIYKADRAVITCRHLSAGQIDIRGVDHGEDST